MKKVLSFIVIALLAFAISPKAYAAPPKTTSSSAFVNYNSIKVTAGKKSGVTGYKFYRSMSKNGTYTLVKTQASNVFTNTGLGFNKDYFYKVRTYKTTTKTVTRKVRGKKVKVKVPSTSLSGYSAVSSAKTKLNTPAISVKQINENVDISTGEIDEDTGEPIVNTSVVSKYVITIKTVTAGADAYRIYRSANNSTWTFVGETNATTFTDTSNQIGSRISYYRVYAWRKSGAT
ncbi:hypothetical protein, partial [Treponema sp. R6D11]